MSGLESLASSGPETLLRAEGLSKFYPPATRALEDFELTISAGEIHGLAGVNGAGKSSFIKILSGVERPTHGRIWLAGDGYVEFHQPGDASRHGIGVVHQELPLMSTLTAAENTVIGLEERRWFAPRQRRQLRREYGEMASLFQTAPAADERLENLRIYAWQVVAIIRALRAGARLLILDEPTSSLNTEERQALHALLRGLSARGIAILYVSHFLDDLLQIADRITVLRDGKVVSVGARGQMTARELLVEMVGTTDIAILDQSRGRDQSASHETQARGENGLSLRDFSTSAIGPVSLSVHPGECVGLYGLAGSGASDLLEGVFGLQRGWGEARWKGRRLPTRTSDRIKAGLALVTGDRKRTLMLDWTVSMNDNLPWTAVRSRFALVNRKAERKAAEETIGRLSVVGESNMSLRALSGGNQQKIALGRWLVRDESCLLADEPTRGVDARGRGAIHEMLLAYASRGNAVLVHSTDPEELIAVCDRVLAIANGLVVQEIMRADLSVAALEGSVRSRSHGTLEHDQDTA